jgi:intein/homing endonuclease
MDNKDPKFDKIYEQIKKVRESKTVELRSTPMLRTEIVGFDGQPQPFKLRYYQVQGIYHLLTVNRMVLGDGTGLGKCVSGDTLLVSDKGMLPIEALKPVNFDGKEGFHKLSDPTCVWTGSRMAPVKSFYWSGTKPSIRVTTRNGYQLEGSLEHPVYVRRAEGETFVKLPLLNEGDFLCIDRSPAPFPGQDPEILFSPAGHVHAKKYSYPTHLDSRLATLLGYVVAEGHCPHQYNVTVTQYLELNPEPHREIRQLFKDLFGWDGNFDSINRDISISVSSIEIRSFLRQCGIDGSLSAMKQVPWCIMEGTRDSVRAFLSAMIEAEGSVAPGGVEFSSASEKLCKQIQVLLLRFGIVSARSPKVIKGRDHIYWRLTFFGDSARIFRDDIGFRSARKQNALTASLTDLSNPNKDLVPCSKEDVRLLKDRLLKAVTRQGANDNRKGSGIKQFGESFQSTFKHILSGRRDPTYPWLHKLLGICRQVGISNTEEYAAVEAVVNRHLFYDPIVKIEAGETEVMDIEVDDPAHCFVGNGVINHNTLQALGAMCYLWERDPQTKVMVVCPKSAIRQWASEVDRFTTGVKVFVATGTPQARVKAYNEWASYDGPALIVMNYHSLVKDWDHGIKKEPPEPGAKKGTQPKLGKGVLDDLTSKIPSLTVVLDEATAFKNPSTKTHQTARFLSEKAKRVWGLTATLLKNNLMEGFGIYKVIRPQTFTSKTRFMDDFCVTELQRIKGGIKVPIVVGYKNLTTFRSTIDPFFYGRPKHLVSTELPALTTREVLCELSPAEDRKYAEALQGVMLMGNGDLKDYQDTKDLTALIYCQQICNSLALLKFEDGDEIGEGVAFEGKSAKESALVDLLGEEFEDEKVIVYTRFEKLVTRLQGILTKEGIKSVRITGAENDKARKKAQDAFQDAKNPVRVVFITDAGSEAINLQAAGAMIFYDTPWSWGTYVQLLGRMIRIGSVYQNVFAVHLVAERPNQTGKKRETIDHKVIAKLRNKKGFIDQIIGEAAVGALRFERPEGELRDLVLSMKDSV